MLFIRFSSGEEWVAIWNILILMSNFETLKVPVNETRNFEITSVLRGKPLNGH